MLKDDDKIILRALTLNTCVAVTSILVTLAGIAVTVVAMLG